MFDYGTFDQLTFDQAPAVEEQVVVLPADYPGGFAERNEAYLKRERKKRRERERLSDAIDRAFARVERNEDLTFEQFERAEEAIERVEASIEEVETPDITPLINLLEDIGKKLKAVEQNRAIARLKRFEDEMDEEHSIETLMLAA